jgi:UPF0271 protein
MHSSTDLRIDLNADVGEGPGEEALYEVITSANIACGGHAGDEASMETAVSLALRHGVAIGAHPSYPDREGFGRISRELAPAALAAAVAGQIASLARVAATRDARVVHVKPHGALYNDAAVRNDVAAAVAEGVVQVSDALILVGLARSTVIALWGARGLRTASEGFADRAYDPGGRLVPRTQAGALVTDPRAATRQALRLATAGGCDTICVHADTPGAVAIAQAVRRGLEDAGFAICALATSGTSR